MKTYQHTQPATTIIRIIGVLFLIFVVVSFFVRLMIPGTVILGVTLWMFRSLTIEISDTELIWYFSSGFPRKRVLLGEIASVQTIQTRLIDGWGIHYTRRGWLYNVSGRGAVAITLKNGKQFCLGTDEPEKLADALKTSTSV